MSRVKIRPFIENRAAIIERILNLMRDGIDFYGIADLAMGRIPFLLVPPARHVLTSSVIKRLQPASIGSQVLYGVRDGSHRWNEDLTKARLLPHGQQLLFPEEVRVMFRAFQVLDETARHLTDGRRVAAGNVAAYGDDEPEKPLIFNAGGLVCSRRDPSHCLFPWCVERVNL